MGIPLYRSDARYGHITRVLRKKQGEIIAAGCSDGSLGSASIEKLSHESILLSYRPESEAPSLYPVNILMGFPRPIQAGRILKDLTSLGLRRIWFTLSELGEKSYAESSFFRTRDFESHLIEGAMQSGNPRLPQVECFWSLPRACDALDAAQRGDGCSNNAPGFRFRSPGRRARQAGVPPRREASEVGRFSSIKDPALARRRQRAGLDGSGAGAAAFPRFSCLFPRPAHPENRNGGPRGGEHSSVQNRPAIENQIIQFAAPLSEVPDSPAPSAFSLNVPVTISSQD